VCVCVCVLDFLVLAIKGLVHPKMKILSVLLTLMLFKTTVFIRSAEHKGRYLEECFDQTDLIPH